MATSPGPPPNEISDPNAFESLLKPLMPLAYRLAYGMLRDRSEAEDAVQDAALRAWQHRRSFRVGAALQPWLFAIVANQCRSYKHRRWWSVVRQEGPASAPAEADRTEDWLDLRTALRRMGHEERLVIVLRYYLDLDYADIALTLGISDQAARSRVQRAVRRLRPRMVVPEEART